MAKDMDYRDFVNINGKLVYDGDGKLRAKQKAFEKVEPKDYKKWTEEERAALWDIVSIRMSNPRRLSTFVGVNTQFKARGFDGLRPVHLELIKQYIRYGDRELAIKGASLTDMKKKGKKV